MKTSNIISLSLLAGMILLSCGKKSDSTATESNVNPDINTPESLVSVSLDTLDTISTEMSAGLSKTGIYLADNELVFNDEDCTDRAEAKARDTDGAVNTDEQGRLLISHARHAIQDFYCKMHRDTGNGDSFVGAVSSTRLLFCLAGNKISYDSQEHALAVTQELLAACSDPDSELPPPGTVYTGKLTASLQPKFGAPGVWDAGLEIVVPDLQIDAKLLLKQADGRLMIATLGGKLSEDAYILAIDRAKGEVRFESRIQRFDIKENSDAVGWSRHVRAWVKGTLDANYRFAAVTDFNAIYSDVSRTKADGSPGDSLQKGSYWTVQGSRSGGVATHAGHLNCSYDSVSGSAVCNDPNRVASWGSFYALACDGKTSESTCENQGIALTGDGDTQFFMLPSNASFEKASTWFSRLTAPSFTLPAFRLSE